jgi:zinc protease
VTSPAVTVPPAVGSPRPWTFPVAVTTQTRAGTPVHVFERPGQHVATVRVTILLPLHTEPREREGVATLMARTLDEGTELRSANDFAAALERHGAAYGVDVSTDALQVEISVPVSHLSEAVALLAEAVTRPAFAAEDVGRHVTIRLGEIAQERASAGYRAREAFSASLFDSSVRRSRPTGGVPDTVRGLTNAEVKEFYRRGIGPDRAQIVFAGDTGGQDVAAVIDAAFGDWSSQADPLVQTPDPQFVTGDRIVVVNRPGSVQTQLMIGCPGTDRRSPDWGAAAVASHVVGGSISSRVDRVLREEKGYTYGTRSGFAAPSRGGVFSLSGSVRTEVTSAAVSEAVAILLAARDGLTETEVAEAKDNLVLTAPLRYEQADSIAQQVGSNIACGVPLNFADTYLAQITATTAETASAAYNAYVGVSGLLVVAVGEADAIAEDLRAIGLGEVRILD